MCFTPLSVLLRILSFLNSVPGVFSLRLKLSERKHFHLLQEGMLSQFSLHIWSLSPWIPCIRVE